MLIEPTSRSGALFDVFARFLILRASCCSTGLDGQKFYKRVWRLIDTFLLSPALPSFIRSTARSILPAVKGILRREGGVVLDKLLNGDSIPVPMLGRLIPQMEAPPMFGIPYLPYLIGSLYKRVTHYIYEWADFDIRSIISQRHKDRLIASC